MAEHEFSAHLVRRTLSVCCLDRIRNPALLSVGGTADERGDGMALHERHQEHAAASGANGLRHDNLVDRIIGPAEMIAASSRAPGLLVEGSLIERDNQVDGSERAQH